jgi:hypothetical protein
MSVLAEGQCDTHERGLRRIRGQRIRRGTKRDLKRLFLQKYARNGNVSKSCREMLVARNTVYMWLKRDRLFAARYNAMNTPLYSPSPSAPQPDFEAAVHAMSDRALMALMNRFNRRR